MTKMEGGKGRYEASVQFTYILSLPSRLYQESANVSDADKMERGRGLSYGSADVKDWIG